MKTIKIAAFIACTVLFSPDSIAQNTFPSNGNVGIGTTDPTSKLTVAGRINAQEVLISTDAGADFVFAEEYDLPELEQVEQFVKTNKHLPEIASEREMQENGVEVNKFQIQLLQKIEELTLYIIDQNKRIKGLEHKLENTASK